MNIVAGKPVGPVKVGDPLSQFALSPLQPLGFLRTELDKKALYQRQCRQFPLGCAHTSAPIGLVIQ